MKFTEAQLEKAFAELLENENIFHSLGETIVRAADEEAMQNAKQILGDKIIYAEDQYKALDGADALLIATEWPVFRTPDFDKIQTLLSEKVIFDGRNLYDTGQMKKLGFYYYSIGRETVKR